MKADDPRVFLRLVVLFTFFRGFFSQRKLISIFWVTSNCCSIEICSCQLAWNVLLLYECRINWILSSRFQNIGRLFLRCFGGLFFELPIRLWLWISLASHWPFDWNGVSRTEYWSSKPSLWICANFISIESIEGDLRCGGNFRCSPMGDVRMSSTWQAQVLHVKERDLHIIRRKTPRWVDWTMMESHCFRAHCFVWPCERWSHRMYLQLVHKTSMGTNSILLLHLSLWRTWFSLIRFRVFFCFPNVTAVRGKLLFFFCKLSSFSGRSCSFTWGLRFVLVQTNTLTA